MVGGVVVATQPPGGEARQPVGPRHALARTSRGLLRHAQRSLVLADQKILCGQAAAPIVKLAGRQGSLHVRPLQHLLRRGQLAGAQVAQERGIRLVDGALFRRAALPALGADAAAGGHDGLAAELAEVRAGRRGRIACIARLQAQRGTVDFMGAGMVAIGGQPGFQVGIFQPCRGGSRLCQVALGQHMSDQQPVLDLCQFPIRLVPAFGPLVLERGLIAADIRCGQRIHQRIAAALADGRGRGT